MPDPLPKIGFAAMTFSALIGGDAVRVRLSPSGPWTVSGGISPDVNVATLPAAEFARLGNLAQGLVGRIELWSESDPDGGGAADVELNNQWIVACPPERVAVVAGDAAPSIISYRLTFADHRQAWVEPRGGRLTDGRGNPDPIQDATLVSNSALINRCLAVMGMAVNAPSSVDDVPPMRELAWECAHAPTELARLLDYASHCYCPHSSGLGYLVRRGVGSLPTIPPDRLMHDAAFPAVDRRPSTVVFVSAPTPVALTYTADAASPPAWQYVAQDSAGEWQKLADLAGLGDPAAAVRNDFKDAPDEDRDRWRSQVYRCLRLDPAAFNARQARILREVFYGDGTTGEPFVELSIATETAPSKWANVTRKVPVSSSTDDNVITLDERLGRLPASAPDGSRYPQQFEAVPIAEVKPSFSVESYNVGTSKREFYAAAFVLSLGAVAALSPEDSQARLSGYRPDTAVYPVAGLRLVRLNGTDANGGELQARCQAVARDMAAEAGSVRRTVRVRGFLPCEISGLISRITYDPAGPTTEIETGGWTAAGGPLARLGRAGALTARPGLPAAGGPAGGAGFQPYDYPATPGQVAAGGAVTGGPFTQLSPAAPPAPPKPAVFPVLVQRDGGADGTDTVPAAWTYTVKTLGGLLLKAAVPLAAPRPKGPATTRDGFGEAFHGADGNLQLWDAGETYSGGGGSSLPVPTALYQVLSVTSFSGASNFTLAFDWVRAH